MQSDEYKQHLAKVYNVSAEEIHQRELAKREKESKCQK
jgi:hypothetical protein